MTRRATLLAVIALAAACTDTTAPPPAFQRAAPDVPEASSYYTLPTIAYVSMFSTTVGPEWSKPRSAVTPSGQHFLGEFLNDTVMLRLNNLPAHRKLMISVDAYIIRSWDGVDPYWGPDV